MPVITATPEPDVTSSTSRPARVKLNLSWTKYFYACSSQPWQVDGVVMGFDPLSIQFRRMAHERGLGIADPRQIDLVGDDVSRENFRFQTCRSPVIWGDQMIRRGFLRPLERLLLHSPLMAWAPFASNVYHDLFWYPTIGRSRIRSFMRTEWGQLFRKY